MRKLLLGLLALGTCSAFAQENVRVGKVSFGIFLKNENFTTKTMVTTQSGKTLTAVQSDSREFSWDVCLVNETKDYAELPYNLNTKDSIKNEVCSNQKPLFLSYRCNLQDSQYLVTTAGGSFVEIKANPEIINIKLSNGQTVHVECE